MGASGSKQLALLAAENVELRKQVEVLQRINQALESKLQNRAVGRPRELVSPALKGVSAQQISDFVETLLQDPEINIKYLPDYVERQLYRNVFTILLGIVNRTLETSTIHFMGHKITLQLAPDEQEKEVSEGD